MGWDGHDGKGDVSLLSLLETYEDSAAADDMKRFEEERRRQDEQEISGAFGSHLVNGEFQSDKYPSCPRGKVPLSCKDKTAQDLLWEYAQRRRCVDAEFASDLEKALQIAGFVPVEAKDDAEYARRLAHRFAGHTNEMWFVDGYKKAIFVAMQRARVDERLRMAEDSKARGHGETK